MKINAVVGSASSTFDVYVNGQQINRVYISGEYASRKYITDQLEAMIVWLAEQVTAHHIQVHRSWIQVDDAYDRFSMAHLVRCQLCAMSSSMVSDRMMAYHGKELLAEVEQGAIERLIGMLERHRYAEDESKRTGDGSTDRASAGDTSMRVSESGHQAGAHETGVDGGLHDAEPSPDKGVH